VVNQTVTVSGIVVGDFENEGVAGQTYLQGYYLQDDGDGNPATSDGIFVFSDTANNVRLGDRVQVTGTVAEFRQQTQLSNVTSFTICSSNNPLPAPVQISLPLTAEQREALEGMLVTFGNQPLFVTDSFLLGRHGELSVATERLFTPTQIAAPSQAAAIQAENDRKRIRIDDRLLTQNPDPVIYPTPGGLSAANTVRGGDRVSNITGIMTQLQGRNVSGDVDATIDYRIHPNDPNNLPRFTATNPRPQTPPSVGGSLKVASFNLFNYFNTFGNACFPNNSSCRGASNATEFTRQRDKLIEAIRRMDADIVGLNELENDGYGSSSSIQDLVNGLNQVMGAGTYAFVNVGVSNLGGDAITNGFIYKPATVEIAPGTNPAFLDTGEFTQGPGRFHRPPLAVTFRQRSNNATFTVVVNHFKSKGSPCDPIDNDPFQGNCNGNRTRAAQQLLSWLATNPTGSTDPDVLIMGDLNSYAMEDPIKTLEAGGFTNLNGPNSYSFSFQGQWGSLDHALANSSLRPQVTGSAKWHINADEPVSLDYTLSFKSPSQQSLFYASDPFRSSDHDPVLVGLNLTPTPPSVNLPLTEGFDNCTPAPAGWQIVDVDGDTTRSWRCVTSFAEANAFNGQQPGDDWLITPPLNLASVSNPVLTFRNQKSSFSDNGLPPWQQLSVLYSTNYSGAGTPEAVKAATWTALTIPTLSTGSFVDSGEISLAGIQPSNRVYIAFRYRSSGTASGSAARWWVDSVNIAGR